MVANSLETPWLLWDYGWIWDACNHFESIIESCFEDTSEASLCYFDEVGKDRWWIA